MASLSSIELLSDADQERVAAIVEECMIALENGVPLDTESLVAEHPQLAEPLRRCLASLQTLHEAVHGLNDTIPNHPALEMGGRLGDFVLQDVIGRGGMGVVYRATQVSLSRDVALKLLPSDAITSAKRLKRFLLEAQAAAQLQHPNIVPVFAVGEDANVYYYAMQWVDGQSLDRCESTVWTQNHYAKLIEAGIDTAMALQHAHDCGIVHRDVKPSNLLMDKQGKLWITDFGLAHRVRETGMTLSGELVGTANYMSPEQAAGCPVDERTDIYSLGATLYELATGRQAFSGVGLQDVLRKIEREDPIPPRKLAPNLPIDLNTIICKAMSKDREDRYETAATLAMDLIAFRDGRPIHGRRPSALKTMGKALARNMPLVLVGVAGLCLSIVVLMIAMSQVWIARNVAQTAFRESQLHLQSSQENYWRGRRLLDQWNDQLVPQLSEIRGAESVRSEMLAGTIQYYEAYLDQALNDPNLGVDTETARLRLAGAYVQLGDTTRAIENFQKGIEQLTNRLSTLIPDHMRALYIAHNDLGLVYLKQGLARDAVQQLQCSIDGHEHLMESYPENSDYQANLAAAHLNLAQALRACDDDANELAHRHLAEKSYRNLLKDRPDLIAYRSELATLLDHRAVSMARTDLIEAIRVSEEAIQLHASCVHAATVRPREWQRFGASLHNLAVLQSQNGLTESSLKTFEKAIEIREMLVRAEPTRADYVVELESTRKAARMVESQQPDVSNAKAHVDREERSKTGALPKASGRRKTTVAGFARIQNALNVAGFARIQNTLNSRESSYESCHVLSYRSPNSNQLGIETLSKVRS